MKLNGQFIYLGIENIQGKKDPTMTYYKLALLQDDDVLKVFLDEDTVKKITDIKPTRLDNLLCELKISIGQKTFVSLESVKKIA